MKQPTAKAMKTLEELQALDFALVELRLYLHTHPEDTEALKQYNETAEQRTELKGQVEAEFGSIAPNEPFTPGKTAGWSDDLWPWQL
ncbi:spore coat protein CotJB [Cohnella zeiphila]|uniref:Spore coat protein CotJB n=1 Tax=Cohnella zeiphila TaxID=2761120 RepID=A0A7X0VXX9_9BACL|nr:spore coat protein CotJB [Cohnella zeiphila]MBB6734784.1 spore coat protein CotJB [Cohnella zeiphila]